MCSVVKRLACAEAEVGWDSPVSSTTVTCCEELDECVRCKNPAHGIWSVSSPDKGSWMVWSDASDLTIGVALEVDGNVVEDGSWLRAQTDHCHVHVAELMQ